MSRFKFSAIEVNIYISTQENLISQQSVSTSTSTSTLFNPFAPGDFAEKRVLRLVEWFSGHCCAIKS